jgi:DnaJ like chaperone protein
MAWWGKLLGSAFGYMLGGPLGALLGTALGHGFDRGLAQLSIEGFGPADTERIQTAFFTTTFSVMGHLAKVDGRVSEVEIAAARSIMARMHLNEDQRQAAIRLFEEGKQPDFPLDQVLEQFRRECHRRLNLIQMFLEIMVATALADGTLNTKERELLLDVCDRLGYPRTSFEHLVALATGFRSHRYREHPHAGPPQHTLADDYAVLGISETANDAEIQKAYRRLMAQHHPDKLVAKGLPEEMIKLATEKTQAIRASYERVKDSRKG